MVGGLLVPTVVVTVVATSLAIVGQTCLPVVTPFSVKFGTGGA